MKNILKLRVLGVAAALSLCGGSLLAQDNNGGGPGVVVVRPQTGQPNDNSPGGSGNFGGNGNFRMGGNFDPAQMQQMMMDQTRQSLNITNNDEWKAIQPLVQNVMDARREVGFGGGGMRMMFGAGGAGGGQSGNQSGNAQRMRFGPQAGAEQQALQKALDDGAPAAQVKEAMAKLRAARQEKQAKLEEAQEKLRSVLTAKQEAQALLMGLLP
jgi:hypothetical protein